MTKNYGSLKTFDEGYDAEGNTDAVESQEAVAVNSRSGMKKWLSITALVALVVGAVVLVASNRSGTVSAVTTPKVTNLAAAGGPIGASSVLPVADTSARQHHETVMTFNPTPVSLDQTRNPTPVGDVLTWNPTPVELHPTEKPTESPIEGAKKSSLKSRKDSVYTHHETVMTFNPTPDPLDKTRNPTPVGDVLTWNPTPVELHPTEKPTESPIEGAKKAVKSRKDSVYTHHEVEMTFNPTPDSLDKTRNPTPVGDVLTWNPTPVELHPTEKPTESPIEGVERSASRQKKAL
jgi:hypothetical protein